MTTRNDTIDRNTASIDQFKLAGWIVLYCVAALWVPWISVQVVHNLKSIGQVEVRENEHYQHLHSDIEEVKGDVKELLQRSRQLVAGGTAP